MTDDEIDQTPDEIEQSTGDVLNELATLRADVLEAMLDDLLEYHADVFDVPQARDFLREVAVLSKSVPVRDFIHLSLPVARRLVAYEAWQEYLRPSDVVAYCAPRLRIAKGLGAFFPAGTEEGIDPEAEYMAAVVVGIEERFMHQDD